MKLILKVKDQKIIEFLDLLREHTKTYNSTTHHSDAT